MNFKIDQSQRTSYNDLNQANRGGTARSTDNQVGSNLQSKSKSRAQTTIREAAQSPIERLKTDQIVQKAKCADRQH